MDFPIAEFMDEDARYEELVDVLHPDGLACPRCQARDALKVHRRHRAPVLDYRCNHCGRVFNLFTGTAFHSARWDHTANLAGLLRCVSKKLNVAVEPAKPLPMTTMSWSGKTFSFPCRSPFGFPYPAR